MLQESAGVNIVSMHAAFNTALVHFKRSGRGAFYLSGGGFAIDEAYSVSFGAQFGSRKLTTRILLKVVMPHLRKKEFG